MSVGQPDVPIRVGLLAGWRTRGRDERGDQDRAVEEERLAVGLALGLPVVLLAMVPAWQFDFWQWTSFALTVPVATWGALPFHRAALANLRRATATPDTLVSLGILTVLGYSTAALFLGRAGGRELSHPFQLGIGAGDPAGQIYLDAAAGITIFVLLSRYLEGRARLHGHVAVHGGAEESPESPESPHQAVVPAEDTRPAHTSAQVGQTQAGEPATPRPADHISAAFVPFVIALAVGTWGFWAGRGAAGTAFAAAAAVLVVACPATVGPAAPTPLLVGYNLLALPVAAAGLLNPTSAGAAAAAGSLLVAATGRARKPWTSRPSGS